MNAYELRKYFNYKDGELYWKVKKHKSNIGDKVGWMTGCGYKQAILDGKRYHLHRIIYGLHNEYMPEQVDHINGNRADNRIENLRPATREENCRNAKLRIDNKSGIKGVSWHKATNKWIVNIRVNGILKHFGTYFDIDYAKFVADAMRHKYHKEFANHG